MTKYSRTFHFSFSPGTTSDDRINWNWWDDISALQNISYQEKLDGEGRMISQNGIFARSHIEPTQNPWAKHLIPRWQSIKNDLGNLQIFGEDLYAIHSIEYYRLSEHFFVFGVRREDTWVSWEEAKFYANFFDFPTVPEFQMGEFTTKEQFETLITKAVSGSSFFESHDVHTGEPCPMEGMVVKNADEFREEDFASNVLKIVRKGHVQTDSHWTRNWKRHPLEWERK